MTGIKKEQYDEIFEKERKVDYPVVTAFEEKLGFKLDQEKLLQAARVLACPLKTRPPNWQHGRIIYAAARKYLLGRLLTEHVTMLDIGTAKGFSALCMRWALDDANRQTDTVISVDVMEPTKRERRNTVAECGGLKTLPEILAPWQEEARRIQFRKATGVEILSHLPARARVSFAFIDGKHTHEAVKAEGLLLSQLQMPGDIAVFDDMHIPGVRQAVTELSVKQYDASMVTVLPERGYAIATRK